MALIVKYKQTIQYFRIQPIIQQDFREIMIKNCPENGDQNFYDILKDIENIIIPSLLHWNHPQFHRHVPVGSNYLSILVEIFLAGLAINKSNWIKNDILKKFEYYVTDLFGRLLHLPPCLLYEESHCNGGGIMQNSETSAIYLCMLAARNRVLNSLNKNPLTSSLKYLNRLVCYTSEDTSYDVIKTAYLLQVKLKLLPVDGETMSLKALTIETQIRKDINKGLIPFFVLAAIGTSKSGAIDDLIEISKIIKKYQFLWYHVSASYASLILVLPEFDCVAKGLKHIDSFDCSPCYWCFTTPKCTCLWVKRRKDIKNLFKKTDDKVYSTNNPTFESIVRKGYDCIKLWFALRCWGKKSLQNNIRNHIEQVKLMEKKLREDEIYQILNKPYFGVVCFSVKNSYGHDPDKVTAELLNRLNKSGKICLTGTFFKGRFAIKCYLGNEWENNDDILNAITIIRNTTNEVIMDFNNQVKSKSNSKHKKNIESERKSTEKEQLQKLVLE